MTVGMGAVRRLPNGLAVLGALALLTVAGVAHVGSPDVYYRGAAGPYQVGVVVRPPGVVPGQVAVIVQLYDGLAGRVTVQPVYWETGTAGAPPPEAAQPVAGAPGTYASRIWLMTTGSYSIDVAITGPKGTGTVNVPVVSAATRELPMSPELSAGLLVLGAFLVFGLLSIVGAASREATLDPGLPVDAPRRDRARVAVAVAAVIFGFALLGGNGWWNSSARDYRRIIYVPLANRAEIVDSAGEHVLHVVITDSQWVGRHETPLVPDHGKLVHLFLVRPPDMDAFAHLHPVTHDTNEFSVAVPPLPAGRYRVYADIVHKSGFAETLVNRVNVRAGADAAPFVPTDSDDSWISRPSLRGDSTHATLADGSIMTWDRGDTALVANQIAPLHFTVQTADGHPAVLQPYMGMAAHAMVTRDDGSVFVHLHPMGTIAMAAQSLFDERQTGDTGRSTGTAKMAMTNATLPDTVSFPYAFPKPGRYRMWIQVRREGRVLTGTFDAIVR